MARCAEGLLTGRRSRSLVAHPSRTSPTCTTSTRITRTDVPTRFAITSQSRSQRPERVQALQEMLLDRLAATEGDGDVERARKLSADVQDRLRSLGYID